MTRTACRKFAIAIFFFYLAPCIRTHAEPGRKGQASSLNKKVRQLYQAGKFSEAIPFAQEALELSEALGPDHPDTATALHNLAALYDEIGNYAKAEPLYQRALKIREKALGPDHPDTATVLNNLGGLYREMDDYAKAESLLQRALKIREKALGPDHPDTAMTLMFLAELYRKIGNYAKAEPLYQQALKTEEDTLGPDHPNTTTALNNLATLYREKGDYAKAESLYQRALRRNEKALGPDHPRSTAPLNNMAALYVAMGDYAKAEPLYQRVLKIAEKAFGPNDPRTAITLNNLAALYWAIGNSIKAERLYERALKIRDNSLDPNHPDTANFLNNLALIYDAKGDYTKAVSLFQRALKIKEKTIGPEHPDTATTINNLARVFVHMGEYSDAEPLYQRALKIDQQALGPDHPTTATILANLALLKIDVGNSKDAASLTTQAQRAEEQSLSNILSFASEEQRLAFQTKIEPYSLAATLGNAEELAQTVLRQKGIVLDSLIEDRLVAEASNDPKQRESIERLRAAKQRLMQLILEVPNDLSEATQKRRAAQKEKLSTEVEQLESGLARQVAGLAKARHALSVTVAQVQAAVPKQAALVEFLRYRHYVGKGKFELRYGAIMIAPGHEPKWIPLGSAEEIEKNIALYRKSTRDETHEATLGWVLKALQERVWAPIEKTLPPGTATVIISPDAELNFVSFATLLTVDERFVVETYSIYYVASGRDLLRETKRAEGPKTTMRVFANPDFALINAVKRAETTNEIAMRSTEMRDLQSISFPNLPGTEKESMQLYALAIKSGLRAQASLGPNATEAELRKVKSPRILHLATHGFFLPPTDLGPLPTGLSRTVPDIPTGKLVNPMHRSGLAVARAQTTLRAWAKGEVPPTENDGIVTAEEVGGLKLHGTWLVVLSACDTGSGQAKAGEGVMGLRRGFIQAGSQNLLMTLWPISDETTVDIMLDFYDRAFKSGNAPQALADTQRDWLVKLRKEHGLLAAVRLAGAFIMSSQGTFK